MPIPEKILCRSRSDPWVGNSDPKRPLGLQKRPGRSDPAEPIETLGEMGNSASCCEDESRGQRNLIAKNRSTINKSEIPAQMRGSGNGSSPQSQRGVNVFTNGANAPVFRRSNISASPPTTPVQARRVEEDETTIWNCGNSPRNAKVPTSSPPPLRSVEKPLYRF